MGHTTEDAEFLALNLALLTVSDTRGRPGTSSVQLMALNRNIFGQSERAG